MRNKSNWRKSQSGQILLYTTIIVMLAALILVPLMQFAFTSHRSAQIREERTLELYASDAGIEDALYQIKTEKKGTDLANLGFGNTSAYNPGTPGMNDRTMDVSVQKVWIPQDLAGNLKTDTPVDSTTPSLDTDKSDKLVVVGMLKTIQAAAASDDFNSGGWTGGNGSWAGDWTHTTGSTSIVSSGGCDGNTLKFADAPGTANRTANLLKYMKPQLKFSAKASSLEAGDTVYLNVTYGNSTPETVWSWADGSETTSCTSFSFDLNSLYGWETNATSVPLKIEFDANLSSYLIASHDFEPPNNVWSGGSGWATNWTRSGGSGNPTGETAILTGNDGNGNPIQGTYYLRLRSNDGYAQRKLNLSSYANPHLQFWAKATSFEGSENAQFLTKAGTSSFTSRLTWRDGGSYPSWPADRKDDNVYHYFDVDLSQFGGGGESNFWIAFDANMGGTGDYFYVDDIKITEGDSFYVDNLWIGDEYNSNTIEIAYTDPNFDLTTGSPGINDPAYLDRIGVWMPPGCHYVSVVGNQTTVELYKEPPTTILSDTYAGGTIVEWDYGNVALHQPPGGIPIVKTFTFAYAVDVTQSVEGMFTWIAADSDNTNPPGQGGDTQDDYISWDKGYEIYKAVSQAHSEIYGTNTQVTAYVSQGEVNKKNAVSYGDYVATGNPLLINSWGSDLIKETAIDPGIPSTWVSKDFFCYDGRSDVTNVPGDGEVLQALLYWSSFVRNVDWTGPDTAASFMYPKRWDPETFAVSSGNLIYTVSAYSQASHEPMDLLAHEPVLTLSNMRYLGEVLGTATVGNTTPDTFFTAHKPISLSPAPSVKVGGNLTSQSGNYTIDYTTGNVTIINPALSGQVTIDYSVSGSMTLTKGTDGYTINQTAVVCGCVSGCGVEYTGFTITKNDIEEGKLQGTVTIDSYYAKHWETVQHAAYDRYGTALPPAQTEVPLTSHVGHTYACTVDVTQLLKDGTGNGQYAVRDVQATLGPEGGGDYATRCFSGWSLVILYKSESETAHQFYLYDPIHNAADCPFMVTPVTDYPEPQPTYHDVPFTLKDFHPPEGTVEGKVTYFVGEGDPGYSGDYVGFKGASEPSYTYLSDYYSPVSNVMNTVSSTGEKGIDVDTYDIWSEVGSDTEANVQLRTQDDRWYLVYMILSFKTNEVPKAEYAFNVASVTYQYELGTK